MFCSLCILYYMKTLLTVVEEDKSLAGAKSELDVADPDPDLVKAILIKNELKVNFNKNGDSEASSISKTTGVNR